MITHYTVAISESDVSELMNKGYQPYGNIISHNGNIAQAMVIYTEEPLDDKQIDTVTPLDNTQQLDLLVRYANDIYSQLIGRSDPNWDTFDTMHGLLSQMSNILRGIHDEVQELAKPKQSPLDAALNETYQDVHERRARSLPPELHDVDMSLVGEVVDANGVVLKVGDGVRIVADDILPKGTKDHIVAVDNIFNKVAMRHDKRWILADRVVKDYVP